MTSAHNKFCQQNSIVQVERLLISSLEQMDELFRQLYKAVFFSTSPTCIVVKVALRTNSVRIVHIICSHVASSTSHALAVVTVVAVIIVAFWVVAARTVLVVYEHLAGTVH